MFIVTGGAGFIGSALVWKLNKLDHEKILVVDELSDGEKWKNLRNLRFLDYMNKNDFLEKIREDNLGYDVETIFHLGACSATTEDDATYLMRNNYEYSKELGRWALNNNARFIYASSAATYGDGSLGYSDDHELVPSLQPLNKYAFSKQQFDAYALQQDWLDHMVGLRYFNVYGPNEYHKGNMRSVVNKSFPQAVQDGTIRLFKSHRDDIEHGLQKRDFLYVKDAVDMTVFFHQNPELSGIYNIGTGQARPFDDLAEAIFEALDKPVDIEYFDMPEDIRPNYQYYTEADLSKLRDAGYDASITSLEEGIQDYVQNYLDSKDPYLTVI
jgi:ADP-L-glycero-D-manno-heptose 6-epimerase